MKNKIAFVALFVGFVIFTLFYCVRYSVAYNEITLLAQIKSEANSLEKTNVKFDLYFINGLEVLNNDKIADAEISFNNTLLSIDKLLQQYANLKEQNGAKFDGEMAQIRSYFDKRKNNIKDFSVLKTQIISDINLLNNNFLSLENSAKFFNFHEKIISFEHSYNKNFFTLGDQISPNFTANENDQKYIENAKNLLHKISTFYAIYEQKDDNLLSIIFEFERKIDENIDRIRTNLHDLNSLFLLFFIAFIALVLCYGFVYVRNDAIKQNYEIILNDFMHPIFITDDNFNIISTNKFATTLFDISRAKQNLFSVVKFTNSQELIKEIKKRIDAKVAEFSEQISYILDGQISHTKFDLKRAKRLNKSIFIITLFDNEKELELAKSLQLKTDEIAAIKFVDPLTKSHNFAALCERLKSNKSAPLICLNISNFADLRIIYDGTKVDEIIVGIDEILQNCANALKIKFEIYHAWMDEFYLLYLGSNIQKDAGEIVEYFSGKTIRFLSGEILNSIKPVFGISVDESDRIYQARTALSLAKHANKEIFYYDKNVNFKDDFLKRQSTITTIQKAIENNRVFVECQAIHDITNANSIWSYEILIRILDENNRIWSPAEFLNIAKDTILYAMLSKSVIMQTFELLRKFPQTHFSFNVSAIDIFDDELRGLIIDNLRTIENPQNLSIEILETEGVEDYDRINLFVNQVKQHGCKISIDDFGSSYSNFYRILSIDFDYIKIDGSIIKKLDRDKNAVAAVEMIVNLAQKQGFDVIAEFVSSDEILTIVRNLGIKYVQGYALSKPISPNYLR